MRTSSDSSLQGDRGLRDDVALMRMHRRAVLLSSASIGLALCGGVCSRGGVSKTRGAEAARLTPVQLAKRPPTERVAMVALDSAGPRSEAEPRVRQLTKAVGGDSHGLIAVGLALGAPLFSGGRAPKQLQIMQSFPGDLLDPARSHGDAVVQVEGATAVEVSEAVRRILEASPDWVLRWRIDGFRSGNHHDQGRGLARNPFHFTDGFGNPSSAQETLDRMLVRSDQDEPDWAVGGTYQVIRVVRLATELWNKDSVEEQERIMGRRRDGRWLDGTPAGEEPNFAADPQGRLTPLDSHVRLAAPDRRNPPPIVRRSYTYDRGNGDTGLIFSCFQRDLSKGFEAVQRRLEGEAMAKYMLTTGGGYFFVPPPGDAWIDSVFHG
ncbi:Dyp-type peroxidase [Streptomyces wuyuanensis]|uniref:Dyp-type peroxidase n=1 Tax=Streptomyces wuyuanensis TaxID=1196353 RepID=UPI0038148D44